MIKKILEKYARWTIKNVEHGIYVPLPSPETQTSIYKAVIDELSSHGHTRHPDEEKIYAQIRERYKKLFNQEEE